MRNKKIKKHFPTIIGILIALLGVNAVFFLLNKIAPAHSLLTIMWESIGIEWGLTIIVLLIMTFFEKQPLSSIGIKKMKVADIGWGVCGFILGIATFTVTTPLLKAFHLDSTVPVIAKLATLPISLRIFIVMTAGTCEEILFRGYPIERLHDLTGNLSTSAIIPYAVFVGAHFWLWGLTGMIQIGVWTIVITLLYVWRRNLPTCILMHILNDGFAFIALPLIFHHS